MDADPDDDMLPVVRHKNLQHPSAAVDKSNQNRPSLFSGFKTRGLKTPLAEKYVIPGTEANGKFKLTAAIE